MPTQNIPIIEDTTLVAKTEPLIENYIVGQMVTHYSAQNDTTVVVPAHSSISNTSKTIIEHDLFIKETSFGIFPNPGNGEFTIKYEVLKGADVKLYVHDTKGILIQTIVNIANQHEGQYQIPVNLNELPNGIYLVSLINNGNKTTEGLVICK